MKLERKNIQIEQMQKHYALALNDFENKISIASQHAQNKDEEIKRIIFDLKQRQEQNAQLQVQIKDLMAQKNVSDQKQRKEIDNRK